MNYSVLLFGMVQALKFTARTRPEFAARLAERDLTAQFRLKDSPRGRWIQLEGGKIRSGKGLCDDPDLSIVFKNQAIAEEFLTPPFDHLVRIDAAKNFKVTLDGPDDLAVWFMSTLGLIPSARWRAGTDMGNGVTRYTSGTNGGPIFVYVKDGKSCASHRSSLIMKTRHPGPSRPGAGHLPRHGAPRWLPMACVRNPWCTPGIG